MLKKLQNMFSCSSTAAASTNNPTDFDEFQGRYVCDRNTCVGGKVVFDERDNEKPACAVILTIKSGSSYDDIYTTIPQVSPDDSVAVKVFHFSYATIPDILRCIRGQSCQSANQTVAKVIQDMLECRSQVDPDSFVVNFECCSGCSCSGFEMAGDPKSVRNLLTWIIKEKHVAMFADFSLKSIISDWSENVLGPNPFVNVGDTHTPLNIKFESEKLLESPNTQLQNLGRMCTQGRALISVMPQTIVFTVDKKKSKSPFYELEILTVVENNDGAENGGSIGHAILRYPSGACILVSAGHWIELTHLDGVSEESLIQTTQMTMGVAEADDLRCELNSATNEIARASVLQKRAKKTLLSSAPCKYSSSR
jgi:hypothetical protein